MENDEIVTVKLSIHTLEYLVKENHLKPGEYMVKNIEPVDFELFKNDTIHSYLKDKSNKAYKELKDYEYKVRHATK